MTKEEVRGIVMDKLAIQDGEHILEIGGGTGSVTLSCVRDKGVVTTIEKKEEGIRLIHQNAARLLDVEEQSRLTVIHGNAPEDLPKIGMFDKVFIGGNGGNLQSICAYIHEHLKEGGLLVATSVTLDTPVTLLDYMEQEGYDDMECIGVQISRMKKIGNSRMMQAENPVQVIMGKKGRR